MLRANLATVIIAPLLLAAGCSDGGSAVGGPDSTAPPTASSAHPIATPSAAVSAQDVRILREFVAFAVRPTADRAGALPLAKEVRLGLGKNLEAVLFRPQAAEPGARVIRADSFRGHMGPFSALDPIRRHADDLGSTEVERNGGAFRASIGQHPHCAAPAVPAPNGFESHQRISIQPSPRTIDGCLSWFTVDLFLNDRGRIEAITLDMWEP